MEEGLLPPARGVCECSNLGLSLAQAAAASSRDENSPGIHVHGAVWCDRCANRLYLTFHVPGRSSAICSATTRVQLPVALVGLGSLAEPSAGRVDGLRGRLDMVPDLTVRRDDGKSALKCEASRLRASSVASKPLVCQSGVL